VEDVRPDSLKEYTIINLVCDVTGIDKPVVRPFETVPIETMPVKGGANVTIAPGIGVKVLSGVVDEYNCAVIVAVVPIKAKAVVELK